MRYSVLASPAVAELEIKRSRFLASLVRVEREDDARAHVAELRRAHHDARHHCSAFVLGPTRSVARSSDDGEPAGTAGVPMLDALLQGGPGDLSDVCAVVVRWFGGVKLGAGGLVRAYSSAVSAAVADARLLTREEQALFDLPAPLADVGRWESALRTAGVTVEARFEGTDATLRLGVPDEPAAVDALRERVTALTAGGGTLAPAGSAWVDR